MTEAVLVVVAGVGVGARAVALSSSSSNNYNVNNSTTRACGQTTGALRPRAGVARNRTRMQRTRGGGRGHRPVLSSRQRIMRVANPVVEAVCPARTGGRCCLPRCGRRARSWSGTFCRVSSCRGGEKERRDKRDRPPNKYVVM